MADGRGIAWRLGIGGTVLAGLVALAFGLSRPDVLVVERFVFTGQARAGEPALRHLADVRNGARLWSVDPAVVSSRIQRHPWVERVQTTRRLDGTIAVDIEEHEPAALLLWDGRILVVDDGGWPFLEADGTVLDLPILVGLGSDVEARDPRIPRLVIRDALWLLDRLDEENLLPRHAISDIAFEWHRGFTVRTTTLAADRPPSTILFGFLDYGRQIRRFAKLVDQGLDWRTGVYVDLAPEKVAVVKPLARPAESGEHGTSEPER